jgi:hypothetical protein
VEYSPLLSAESTLSVTAVSAVEAALAASVLLKSPSAPSISSENGLVTGFEAPVDRSVKRVLRPCEMSGSVVQLLLLSTVSNPDQLASVALARCDASYSM